MTGRHAVVTGGSRGIGRAIVQRLLDAGARVSVLSRSASAPPDGAFSAIADVSDEGAVERALAACREINGAIEVLVNCAGIAQSAPLARTTTAMWERILATNLSGTFYCTRDALPDMRATGYGRILNVASIAGLYGAPYVSAYCASKHGVVGFTRAIAAELEGTGITANALCPGYTETDLVRAAVANIVAVTGVDEDAARQRLARDNPGGRIAAVDEVAEAAMTVLLGAQTGQAIVVPA